jgi:hypothetical protein
MNCLLTSFSVVATCTGMMLIERSGRRPLFLGCSFINLAALLVFVVSAVLQPKIWWSKYGCVFAIVVYGISYRSVTDVKEKSSSVSRRDQSPGS